MWKYLIVSVNDYICAHKDNRHHYVSLKNTYFLIKHKRKMVRTKTRIKIWKHYSPSGITKTSNHILTNIPVTTDKSVINLFAQSDAFWCVLWRKRKSETRGVSLVQVAIAVTLTRICIYLTRDRSNWTVSVISIISVKVVVTIWDIVEGDMLYLE